MREAERTVHLVTELELALVMGAIVALTSSAGRKRWSPLT
jgi:hypothetical protein